MTLLGDLLHALPGVKLRGPRRSTVGGIVLDSRQVQPGSLFAALRGSQSDGRLFIREAVHRGASAILSEPPRPEACGSNVAWIESENPRRVLAQLARRFYGAPDERLEVIGITGTDGKTSTSHLLSSALFASGIPTALGGTLGQKFGAMQQVTELTTPEAPTLYSFLAQASADDAQAAILEVSSAGLIADRVYGMNFDGAILTGIGSDHLDLHGSTEEYLLAKRRLFEMLPSSAFAVLAGDDPNLAFFREATTARVSTFGEGKRCDWRVSNHRPTLESAVFTLEGPDFCEEIEINRPAEWDALNLAASVAAAVALGASAESAARGAACCPPIPGRWEAVDAGQPYPAIVDYAHTPEALGRALAQLRALVEGKVIVVFGCGGERDQDKRQAMGAVAGRLADIAIVTDDNPRYEDPDQIASAITAALEDSPCQFSRIPDRSEAIRCAVARASDGDGVLVAGKGHEAYQEIDGRRTDFDDRQQLAEAIRSDRGRE